MSGIDLSGRWLPAREPHNNQRPCAHRSRAYSPEAYSARGRMVPKHVRYQATPRPGVDRRPKPSTGRQALRTVTRRL